MVHNLVPIIVKLCHVVQAPLQQKEEPWAREEEARATREEEARAT